MEERETGYYWVKVDFDLSYEVGFWHNKEKRWTLCGSTSVCFDENFHEIIEVKIILPGK